jgi:hypothetical protein
MSSIRGAPRAHHDDAGTRSEEHRAARAELRARLAAERAELLCSLLGVDVQMLDSRPLVGEASAATFLGAVAAQEHSFATLLEESLGSAPLAAADRARPEEGEGFDAVLSHCIDARSRFLDALARVPDDVVFASDQPSGASSPLVMATQCYANDSSLSLRAGAWSRQEGLGESVGPSSLLRAAARAARKEFLTTVALVPTEARQVPAFEAGRTLPEIFRMVTQLEQMFLKALAQAGIEAPQSRNSRNVPPADEWQRAWADLHGTHAALLGILDLLDPVAFTNDLTDGEGDAESIYMWARGCLLHDRLHAAHIRADLGLDWPERLLR